MRIVRNAMIVKVFLPLGEENIIAVFAVRYHFYLEALIDCSSRANFLLALCF